MFPTAASLGARLRRARPLWPGLLRLPRPRPHRLHLPRLAAGRPSARPAAAPAAAAGARRETELPRRLLRFSGS